MNNRLKTIVVCLFTGLLLSITAPAIAEVKGIYLTQYTLENTNTVNYLIKRAKEVGINTFVIDFDNMTKLYQKNIKIVEDNNIRYVARVVIFPGGGTKAQLNSEAYREKKFALMQQAVGLGAQAIQLDYIRYQSKNRPSPQNAQDVNQVIKWYRDKVHTLNVPMQIDVFGITSFHEEKRIGQNPGLFASNVDALCPMVYPSHYEPFRLYSAQPYKTVNSSLLALKSQINETTKNPPKIYAFIEVHNYRYPLSKAQNLRYIAAQIKGVDDAKVDGWYFWSANNKYEKLFTVLRSEQNNTNKNINQAQTSKVAVNEN